MFVHQSYSDKQHDQDTTTQPAAATAEATTDNAANDPATESPIEPVSMDDAATSGVPAATDDPAATSDQPWQHPGTPTDNQQAMDDVISPAGGFPKAPKFPQAAGHDSNTPSPSFSDA